MAKLKIANTVGSIVTDQFTSPTVISSNHLGGVGGDLAQTNPTIKVSFRVDGTNYDGWIIAQKGIRKFRVTDGTRVATCTLVNLTKANLAVDGTMTILCTKAVGGNFNASRITNKYVYDFVGNRYRYWLATASATFVKVNFG